jgi:hypothetical protein
MSTPTQVLGQFWDELREKSRVRVEHPDWPADLGAAASELVATLWTPRPPGFRCATLDLVLPVRTTRGFVQCASASAAARRQSRLFERSKSTVRDNLRHVSVSTTSTYLHGDDEKQAQQIRKAFEGK